MEAWTPSISYARLSTNVLAISLEFGLSLNLKTLGNRTTCASVPDLAFWEAVWVQSSSELSLFVGISIDCHNATLDPSAIASKLARDLQKWEIGFEPVTGESPKPSKTNQDTFQLSIQLRRQPTGNDTAANGCVANDYIQPCGVSMMTLDGLRLDLRVQNHDIPRKRRKLQQNSCGSNFSCLLGPENCPDENCKSEASPVVLSSSSNQPLLADMLDATDRDVSSPRSADCQDLAKPRSFTHQELLLPEDDIEHMIMGLQTGHTSAETQAHAAKEQYEVIVSLVDAAFRRAIVSKPRKLASAVHLYHEDCPVHLIDIAPCVFCPGYLQACTELARYASSIAASLANITRRMRHGASRNDEDGARARLRNISASYLESNLWLIIRKKFLRPGKARRFRPLKALSNTVPETERPDVELLVDGSTDDDSFHEHGLVDLFSLHGYQEHGTDHENIYDATSASSWDSGLGLDMNSEDKLSANPVKEIFDDLFDCEDGSEPEMFQDLLDLCSWTSFDYQ